MATVNFEHRSRERRQDRVYLRLSHKGTNKYVSTEVKVPEKHWNPSKQEARKTHPDFQTVNRHLARIHERAQTAINEVAAGEYPLSADRIKRRYEALQEGDQPSHQDFIAFAREFVAGYEERGQINTFESYRAVLNKLEGFVGGSVPFDQVTASLVRDFRTHLYSHHGNAKNTVAKNLNVLRTFCRAAIREGHMRQEDYPFFDISIETEQVKKERIPIEQIEALADLDLEEGSPRWHARNYFIFAFYAGGMRWSDVATIRWQHLKGGRVAYKMQKTGDHVSLKLPDPGREVLAHYRHREEDRELVFPILDGIDPEDDQAWTQAIKKESRRVGRLLEKIGESMDLDVRLSFHLARHSFADHLRRQGADLYNIRDALGHESIQQTEEYLAGFDSEGLDDMMDSAF